MLRACPDKEVTNRKYPSREDSGVRTNYSTTLNLWYLFRSLEHSLVLSPGPTLSAEVVDDIDCTSAEGVKP